MCHDKYYEGYRNLVSRLANVKALIKFQSNLENLFYIKLFFIILGQNGRQKSTQSLEC